MFDGNGNWTSDFSAQADRDNGIKILASRFDNIFIADIKESFENCLTKDGQIAPIGNFNMGGQKITNVGNGTNDNDAVNKIQIDNLSDNLQTQINTKANSSSVVNLTGTQTISGQKTFSKVAYGTASDVGNSIVTTVNKSKAANGYFRLGNGMIIQWGRYDHGSNSAGFKATITLPTPFSNTNYSFSLVGTRQNDDDMTAAVNVEGRAKATTYINFQCSRTSGTSAGIRYIDWLAIGY